MIKQKLMLKPYLMISKKDLNYINELKISCISMMIQINHQVWNNEIKLVFVSCFDSNSSSPKLKKDEIYINVNYLKLVQIKTLKI